MMRSFNPAFTERLHALERAARLGMALTRRDEPLFRRVRRVVEVAWWLDRMRAAVAFDAAASAGFGFVSSWSWNHTATGADRFVLVSLHPVNDVAVSSITYGGTNMTLLGTQGTGAGNLKLYKLVAPATGLQSVSITWAASTRGEGGSISFTGVDQSTPHDAMVGESAGDASIVVTSAVNDLVTDFICANTHATPVAGAGQTARFQQNDGGGFGHTSCSTKAGAASVTMSWTSITAQQHAGVNVNQVPPKAGLLFLLALSHPFYVMGHGHR